MSQMPQQQLGTAPPLAPEGSQPSQPGAMPVAPPRKPKVNPFMTPGSLVLLALCVAGFSALYVLGRRMGPRTALGDQTLVYAKVDAALDSMGGKPSQAEMAQRTDATVITANFYRAATQRQVELKRLTRNPFVFRDMQPEPALVPVPNETVVRHEVPAERKAALEALKDLRLQTVLVGKGKTNAALVSNNLITTGQVIRGWKVTKIGPHGVELTWQDITHTLELPR